MWRRIDSDVGRLNTILGLDQAFEDAVDHVEDVGVTAEVGGEAAFHPVLGFNQLFDDFEIGLDIRAAERVYRLLRVANDENLSGGEFYIAPFFRRIVRFFREIKKNFILDRVRVLKFVDENRAELLFQLLTYARMIAHEVAGADEQS